MVNSSKSTTQLGKLDHFTSSSTQMAYKNTFSNKNILGERKVSVSDLSNPVFAFIEDIFKKMHQGKLKKKTPTLYVKIVKSFMPIISPYFHYQRSTIELSSIVISNLYDIYKITNLGFPYKEIGASSKNHMSDLFFGLTGLN